MKNVLRFSLLSWLILAVYAVAILSGFASLSFADDSDRKAKAALALAMARQSAPPVTAHSIGRTPEQAAKAALAEAMGRPCDCGLCDTAKPMPKPEAPKAEAPKRSVEKMDYVSFAKIVAKLKPTESIRVYIGQKAPVSAVGRLVELSDSIPGEEQKVGVWRCWVEKDGKPTMQSWHPDDKAVRIMIGNYYYDQFADGSIYWCVECNRGR